MLSQDERFPINALGAKMFAFKVVFSATFSTKTCIWITWKRDLKLKTLGYSYSYCQIICLFIYTMTQMSFCIADLDNPKKNFKLSEWLLNKKYIYNIINILIKLDP